MTENKPFVSVVIPAYNARKTMGECVEALKNQSYPHDRYEIVVVDDGSADDTADVASVERVTVIRQGQNQGPAVARNTGVSRSRGDIILFTDADCIAAPDFIDEMMMPFSDPAVVGVKGAYRTRQHRLWARFAQVEFEERYCKLAKAESIDFVDSHAAAFRKDVFLEVGGFDPHFPVANNEDVDLSYKIAGLGYHMVFNPRAIVYHTHPDTALKYLRIKFFRAYWRMLVYRRFPEKIVSDTYTPQTLKLQIITVALLCLSIIAGCFSPQLLTVIPYLVVVFLLSAIPIFTRAARTDPMILWFVPAAITLRSIVFGLGVFLGFLSQRKRDLMIPMLLLVGDITAVMMAYVCSFYVRTIALSPFLKPFDHTLELYISLFPLVLLILIISAHARGLYRSNGTMEAFTEFALVTRSVSFSVLAIITLSFFWKWDYSRSFILLYWILAIVLGNLMRLAIRALQHRMRVKGYHVIRTVIVGGGETAKLLTRRLKDAERTGVKIIGVVDHLPPDACDPDWQDIPYLGPITELDEIIRQSSVDDVFIAKPDLPHKDILDLVVRCEKTGAGFKIVSDLVNIVTGRAGLSPLSGLPIVDLKEERHDWGRRMVKRLEDLILGSVIFVITLPFMLIFGVIIHISILGSVLVEEERVGRHGRLFKMIRFRVVSKGSASSQPETLIGRFLRRTYLEELPQLLNVIRGEMSLVGPRPEVPEIVASYEVWQRKRLAVAPGITGLWQIIAPGDRPLHENLEYDFFYIKNYDIWMDLSILLQTIPIILLGKRYGKR